MLLASDVHGAEGKLKSMLDKEEAEKTLALIKEVTDEIS